ncbi:MAG TPA: hypothetical protein PKX87_04445, partial [Alphaproteobacteria bacterium]|nr:hypothetical protein [Alphaproteobacteria bacterium]
ELLAYDAGVILGHSTIISRPARQLADKLVGGTTFYLTGDDEKADAYGRRASIATSFAVNAALLDATGAVETAHHAATAVLSADHPFEGLKAMADEALQAPVPNSGAKLLGTVRNIAGVVDDASDVIEAGKEIVEVLTAPPCPAALEPSVLGIVKGLVSDAFKAGRTLAESDDFVQGCRNAVHGFMSDTEKRFGAPDTRPQTGDTSSSEALGSRLEKAKGFLKEETTNSWAPVKEDLARGLVSSAKGAQVALKVVESVDVLLNENLFFDIEP